jgi:hypothetical protein
VKHGGLAAEPGPRYGACRPGCGTRGPVVQQAWLRKHRTRTRNAKARLRSMGPREHGPAVGHEAALAEHQGPAAEHGGWLRTRGPAAEHEGPFVEHEGPGAKQNARWHGCGTYTCPEHADPTSQHEGAAADHEGPAAEHGGAAAEHRGWLWAQLRNMRPGYMQDRTARLWNTGARHLNTREGCGARGPGCG